METKVLIIAIVKKEGSILMRKKPDGSPPYSETWYLFGAEAAPNVAPDDAIKAEILTKTGISVNITNKLSWDTEIKHDLDGIEKFFVYLDIECQYIDGEIRVGEGIEKIEWIKPDDLEKYDIVPPSKTLFRKLGYIK